MLEMYIYICYDIYIITHMLHVPKVASDLKVLFQ